MHKTKGVFFGKLHASHHAGMRLYENKPVLLITMTFQRMSVHSLTITFVMEANSNILPHFYLSYGSFVFNLMIRLPRPGVRCFNH